MDLNFELLYYYLYLSAVCLDYSHNLAVKLAVGTVGWEVELENFSSLAFHLLFGDAKQRCP